MITWVYIFVKKTHFEQLKEEKNDLWAVKGGADLCHWN